MLRTILRPGWIALAVVVVAFAVACFTLLAPWQLGKNSSTEHRNDLIEHAVDTPPAPLAELAPTGTFDPSTEWREVRLTGRFRTDQQAIVRLRNVDERPAVEVLTPFAVAGTDRTIVVDRGFVRPEQGQIPHITPAPAGEVTIVARIRASEGTSPDRVAHTENGIRAVYTIDPAELSRVSGVPLDRFYLQLSPDQPGALGEIPLPQLESGPYLSYGLQWLAFGIMAPLGAAYFLYSEIRHRRGRPAKPASAGATPSAAGPPADDSRSSRRRRLREDLQAAGTVSGSKLVGQVGAGPDAAEPGAADKLSKRYGG